MISLPVEVLMKVYQVEIDPDEEFDPENLQDLLGKEEGEGDVQHVKLDLTRNEGTHVGNKAFLDKLFEQLLVWLELYFCFLLNI